MTSSASIPDTGSVEREVHIAAPPEMVFRYLTEPDLYVRWEGTEAELDPRAGGIYRVHITPGFIARGEFVEVDGLHRVAFTFGWEGNAHELQPGSTLVELSLTPDAGGTLLHVRHSQLKPEILEDHGGGWDHYLGRLVVAAAGGDPGPDPRLADA